MIFVTVGTHEQSFERLVKCVDDLKGNGMITDDVVIQTGFTDYEPHNCEWKKLFSYQQMKKYVEMADLVITHGGPSSFIMPLQVGKVPIVVPRQKKYDEHVNDHQLDFALEVASRQKNIIVVKEIFELQSVIQNYTSLVNELQGNMASNNELFNSELEKIVKEMMGPSK